MFPALVTVGTAVPIVATAIAQRTNPAAASSGTATPLLLAAPAAPSAVMSVPPRKPAAAPLAASSSAAVTPASLTPLTFSTLVDSFKSAQPHNQALAVVAAAGAVVGLGYVIGRWRLRAAQVRSLLPENTRYTQYRVSPSALGDGYADLQAAQRLARASVPSGHPWYVYIGAATNPATGKPWCGDCTRANPLVHAAFDEAYAQGKDLVMVSAMVNRETYKDPLNTHPFRTDSELHLTAVPTLFKFVHGACIDRLVEGQCHDMEAIRAFLNHTPVVEE